jgi:hypothetical protein
VPVQFDEREEETEPRQTGLRRPDENLTNRHREAKVNAPFSTLLKYPYRREDECKRDFNSYGRICRIVRLAR